MCTDKYLQGTGNFRWLFQNAPCSLVKVLNGGHCLVSAYYNQSIKWWRHPWLLDPSKDLLRVSLDFFKSPLPFFRPPLSSFFIPSPNFTQFSVKILSHTPSIQSQKLKISETGGHLNKLNPVLKIWIGFLQNEKVNPET